mmetsp:Transcript_23143/g.69577  ORF Transcript_23143/g.69577 Transcript_23143/m.69577 type:complete len:506 (-) Transcript_23143:38-1555(-)
MGVKKKTYAPANYESVAEALVGLYGEKVREAEKAMLFDRFTTSLLSDAELLAKPMVLLLGQYSSGKTTFIRYLAGSDFPGIHIGPEPTTDGFAALMDGSSPTPIPGNAATSSKQRPFRALSKFGAAFLNKFCISELKCDLTKQLTLIDTPGILAGSKQTMGRNYDFASIVKWFAERSDMILLLFDAHKIDISDELKSVIESLHQHDEKMRLVLNKADALTTEEIMHVYGGTMWFLGKVFKTPEVKRSYMSSFWEKPLKNAELERFMTEERERLLSDLYALPQGARTRKVNEFIKRVRAGRAHCLVFNHLRKEMPTMMGKAKAKERLLANLPDEFRKISQNTNVPLNDFPNPYDYQKLLATYDFSKLPKASKEMLQTYEDVIERDLPGIMQHFTSRPSDAPGGGGGGGGERVEELKGWLHKQSTNGRWQRRYFILRDQKLEYYRKPEDAQPGGTLELQGCAAKAHKDAERDFVIRIETEERPYHLAAGSGDDMSNWLLALRGHCGR